MRSTRIFLIFLLAFGVACNNSSNNGEELHVTAKKDSIKDNKIGNKQYKSEQVSYDTIAIKDIILNNKYSPCSMGKGLWVLLKKADSITHDSSGMGDCYSTTFYFKKSSISLCDSVLFHFEIMDNSLAVSIKSKEIKIGEKDDILKQMFPKSYSVRDTITDDSSIYHNRTCIRIYCDEMDYLLFMINDSGQITDILLWEDNS